MDIHLVVVRPFAGHARGTVIADAAQIAQILGGAHRLDVVRVMAAATLPAPPAPPAPAAPAAKKGG
jgi:hypothetical protein